MNHKRGRPKNRRAGCLFCKPHKANGCKRGSPSRQEQLAREGEPFNEEDAAEAAANPYYPYISPQEGDGLSVAESYPEEIRRRVEAEARALKPLLDATARYLGEL